MLRSILLVVLLVLIGASCVPNILATAPKVVRNLRPLCFTTQGGSYKCVDESRAPCGSDTDCEALR